MRHHHEPHLVVCEHLIERGLRQPVAFRFQPFPQLFDLIKLN